MGIDVVEALAHALMMGALLGLVLVAVGLMR